MKKCLLIAALAAALTACTEAPQGPAIAELAKQGAAATREPTRASAVLSREDLPPEGTRALFDHLVAQADGVPWPFEKLVALVAQHDPTGAAPKVLLIPDGRSLLKGQADYAHPRVLVAADYQAPGSASTLGLAPRGQLFLGFTELANEIEVISYNEAAGRFEFQLVQDYSAHGARKLVYAKRAICESCHQGGAPIFSVRPWGETNAQPATAERIHAARNGQPYLGLPLSVPLAVPERYDELTDVGSFIVATQRIWLDHCATAECRRALLQLALAYAAAPGDFKAEGPAVERLRALLDASAAPVPVPASDLASRDPIAEAAGLKGWWRGLFKPTVKLGDGAKTNEDLEAFDRLPKLPAALDPLSPRPPPRTVAPTALDGVYGLASLFSADDINRLLAAAQGQWPAVEAGVQRLPDTWFAAAPFSRVKTLQALLAPGVISAASTAPDYCCLSTAELSPPIASGEPPVLLAAGSPLQPYADYCFACHRGNPSKRLNFMAGATEAEVRERIAAQASIREALDWPRYQGTDKAAQLMPPLDSPQHAALEAALQQNPKLLDDMRAVVPGLFDF